MHQTGMNIATHIHICSMYHVLTATKFLLIHRQISSYTFHPLFYTALMIFQKQLGLHFKKLYDRFTTHFPSSPINHLHNHTSTCIMRSTTNQHQYSSSHDVPSTGRTTASLNVLGPLKLECGHSARLPGNDGLRPSIYCCRKLEHVTEHEPIDILVLKAGVIGSRRQSLYTAPTKKI